jgi:hypothetical protein
MQTDRIKQGETFGISIELKDTDGEVIAVDETWSFGCRICKDATGGETIADVAISLVDGIPVGSYNTDLIEPGLYFYDTRATDSDGNDYWSCPVRLIIEQTNTPFV